MEITGEDKDQLVVVGCGIDAVRLAALLRKKYGLAEILVVESVKKEKTQLAGEKGASVPDYNKHPTYNAPELDYVEYYPLQMTEDPKGCSIM